ncbi:DNA glycosylase AlkZ-like family protein [Nonomuraea sp. SBT364]|uniref:DNA glycosylase AlkZ-like family protein n=1 Tax=Nonomuraea sp. SBT364 TaxID=1580530 RepID=UPI000A461A2F
MPAPLLTSRHLNRATLARQHLLTRTRLPALDLAGHLVGLQAQDPDPPYVGLWSRIDGFRLGDLTELLERREMVRATLFRGTQHLVPARDYLWLRPLLEPMLARWQRASFGRLTAGIDPAELAAAAHDLLSRGPLNRPDLGRALAARWPGHDAVALARSVQGLLPIVHPPPDGTWRRRGLRPRRPLPRPAPRPRRLVTPTRSHSARRPRAALRGERRDRHRGRRADGGRGAGAAVSGGVRTGHGEGRAGVERADAVA